MKRLNRSQFLLALALAGCTADTATEAPIAQYDRQPTPITGECQLAIQPPQPVSPGVIRNVDPGECIVSHLGLSEIISDRITDTGAGTQTVQNTFIAANGDSLYANGAGTNQFIAPGRVAFQATLTFAGGTGRFADASGTATISGVANFFTGQSHFTMTGTIVY